jgi:hypothetical protein
MTASHPSVPRKTARLNLAACKLSCVLLLLSLALPLAAFAQSFASLVQFNETSGEFFSDIVSFESSAGTRCAGLVLEIIVSHPHVPGRGSRPARLDGCNDLRVLLPAERDHVQGGTAQRCNTSQGNLGIVERDELGALFDPACGSDSILCVVAQDLFDRRIVLSVGEKGDLF